MTNHADLVAQAKAEVDSQADKQLLKRLLAVYKSYVRHKAAADRLEAALKAFEAGNVSALDTANLPEHLFTREDLDLDDVKTKSTKMDHIR